MSVASPSLISMDFGTSAGWFWRVMGQEFSSGIEGWWFSSSSVSVGSPSLAPRDSGVSVGVFWKVMGQEISLGVGAWDVDG